jgi:hypothetical protein
VQVQVQVQVQVMVLVLVESPEERHRDHTSSLIQKGDNHVYNQYEYD